MYSHSAEKNVLNYLKILNFVGYFRVKNLFKCQIFNALSGVLFKKKNLIFFSQNIKRYQICVEFIGVASHLKKLANDIHQKPVHLKKKRKSKKCYISVTNKDIEKNSNSNSNSWDQKLLYQSIISEFFSRKSDNFFFLGVNGLTG